METYICYTKKGKYSTVRLNTNVVICFFFNFQRALNSYFEEASATNGPVIAKPSEKEAIAPSTGDSTGSPQASSSVENTGTVKQLG